ncbi:MAG: hypothetical protein GY845_08620 [Planctomycetes bacterium]|nr:hypothetical protein [Planctomycetota bacterium]
MSQLKDQIIYLIGQKARTKAAALAGRYVRAKPEEREAIQAGIEIEKEFASLCELALEKS